MKGFEPLIAAVFIILISIIGIIIVFESTKPSVKKLEEISLMEEGKNILTQIDNAVRDVAQEGEGSSRFLSLSVSGGNYVIDTENDAIVFSMDSISQLIGVGISKTEGNINMFGEPGRVLLNISYLTVNITDGGSFGKGYHTLIIRNNGYDFLNQKQIISISLILPVLPPTALTVQYNQTGVPYISKGGSPSGDYNDLNVLGEGLTYDVPEAQDSLESVSENFINCWNFGDGTSCYDSYWTWTASDVNFIGGGEDSGSPQYQVANDNITNIKGANYYGNHTQTFDVNSSVINNLISAELSFKYEPTNIQATSEIRIYLVRPDNSESLLWSTSLTTSGSWISVSNIDLTNNFTQAGNYKIKLWVNGVTGKALTARNFKSRWDDINLTITWNKPKYRVEVWHNSSQIANGNINSINSTVNFTTNISDDYSLQIYDWLNSQWTNCYSNNVLADTPTQWWCNMTTNPMNYNSSDRRIRIRINSTPDFDVGLLKEDYVQYYVSYMP